LYPLGWLLIFLFGEAYPKKAVLSIDIDMIEQFLNHA
jgi:hypothetical protein